MRGIVKICFGQSNILVILNKLNSKGFLESISSSFGIPFLISYSNHR